MSVDSLSDHVSLIRPSFLSELLQLQVSSVAVSLVGSLLLDAAESCGHADDQGSLIRAADYAYWVVYTNSDLQVDEVDGRPELPAPLETAVDLTEARGQLVYAVSVLSDWRSDFSVAACARAQQLLAWVERAAR